MPIIKNISELNERIIFTGSGWEGPNEDNGWQVTEVKGIEVYRCWGKVKTQTIKEVYDTVGTILQDTVNFVIRSQQGYEIDTTLQIKWRGVVYDIISINPDTEEKKYDVIMAKKFN